MSEIKIEIIEFLRVLGDQTRLDILDLLQHEKKTSLQIQKKLNKSQSTKEVKQVSIYYISTLKGP